MDLKICGILDLILLVGTIIFFIIGYKKGFMKKVLSLAGALAVFLVSIIFAGQFAQFLISNKVIYPAIFDNIFNNCLEKLASKGVSDTATLEEVLNVGLGVPKMFSGLISNAVTAKNADIVDATSACSAIASYLAGSVMNFIAFLILVAGIWIIILICKLIAVILKKNVVINVIDSILGGILYIAIFTIIVCVFFCILSYLMRASWFSKPAEWFTVDMQLDNNNFRISKFIYNGNIITRLLNMFF